MKQLAKISVVAIALGAAACQPDDDSSVIHPQYVEVVDGTYHFYIGTDVMAEHASTGSFTPTVESWYVRISVPAKLVPSSADELTTISTCNPAFDVQVYSHTYIGPEEAIASRPNPPDPFISTTDEGEMITQFRTGDPFVYGTIQVGFDSEGWLAAGVHATFLVEYDDGPALERNGALGVGIMSQDPAPDDPMLLDASCAAPPFP